MVQLEEIHKLLAGHSIREDEVASIYQRNDGGGYVSKGGLVVKRWNHPSEAMDIIRKALAPPPPTKEEAMAAVRFLDMCVAGLGTCRDQWEAKKEILRRFIESTGD